jgi:hypothetical protein
MVVDDLLHGDCADAVVSSIPGSNYTYRQISSLLSHEVTICRDNILDYQNKLTALLVSIAYDGFPSVSWLEQIDMNSSKLINDARKVAFAKALGRFNVPVLIPYGNEDSNYKNEVRSVNILSLVANVSAFSASDRLGRRLKGYPYSPLSVGDELSVYPISEIPDPQNPFLAHLDINEDGFIDYTFERKGRIAFRDKDGLLAFAPPVLSETEFKKIKNEPKNNPAHKAGKAVVLTLGQYRQLNDSGLGPDDSPEENEYVWLNSPYQAAPFHFKAVPWVRGFIRGTSLIPPTKVKQRLGKKIGLHSKSECSGLL